jgi:hypothetical protein
MHAETNLHGVALNLNNGDTYVANGVSDHWGHRAQAAWPLY